MAYEIATATNAGAGGLAHYDLLDRIKTFLSTNAALVAAGQAWTVLRYDTVSAERELIVQGPGLSGTEQIFIGLKCYQSATSDYYNLLIAGFTGYVAGNTFETQPGISGLLGIPAHNLSIPYWLVANGQRFACAIKVGTPVYESFYGGKFLPYATPAQYPYPLVAGGMLGSKAAVRYSDTSHSMPYKGACANLQMRFVDGTWKQPECYPYDNATASAQLQPVGTNYHLTPVTLTDVSNVYGELDGIFHITGFNNAVENTVVIGGITYVVIQDVWRTGFGDYYALRLD